MLPRISIPSQVDEVLELDTLLRVGSCVILRIQSFLVLRHPTDTIKRLWTKLKHGVNDKDQIHSLPKIIYLKVVDQIDTIEKLWTKLKCGVKDRD